MTNKDLHNFDYANIFNYYTDEEGFNYYNLYNTINIDPDIDESLYYIHPYSEYEDFYSISYKYYSTTRLWWTILLANQIINPFEPIPNGKPLKILKSEVISEILNQITLDKRNR